MPDALPETMRLNRLLFLILGGLAGMLAIAGGFFLPRLLDVLLERFASSSVKDFYHKVIEPDKNLLSLVIVLTISDVILLAYPRPEFLKLIELPISLSLAITISFLGSQLFKRFFDAYLLNATLQAGRKVNSELLILAKLVVNLLIIVVTVIIFAQTHQINILGLVASLGIGGLSVAFAAQKTLEQLLGGIVIYIDRPFIVDDYIGLPDGTFGRVESIGLRSTKIRTSGKGTLMIVPNSELTQVSIENFTGGKKVISIISLVFYRAIPDQEKSLIRQVIVESTMDIFGIDARSTEVSFKDIIQDSTEPITQAQINFFILGSGEFSMELRRQVLDIAKQNITNQLKEYGIAFDIAEQTINVDSPITV
ncbi:MULTISPECIES: mechanosensitive ion channel family protein [unclassified Coleofasciculus]|uniref:mechanosensitive ion channel family protein n=1 Tax=unclassified Coleofasciculus TaxID=2692782 RepID=UPI0018807EE9|nr:MULTISPECIES: mechanosensitive ion channel domain-containing protein [unclassified Coleofasciculus]MBE9125345.1 mechanosensitive ion channel [Coleofasciculus sp. LEGE 07081]MBE9148548.1 mechanosensitive ion channel [Coleofasciculus sp. LEGE 07092]